MNSKNLALVFSVVMVLSSFAGCIESEDDTAATSPALDDSVLGNVMVSTYHVAELARAVGGDRLKLLVLQMFQFMTTSHH